jgi:peptide-methionine (S)-S-oxide reductase
MEKAIFAAGCFWQVEEAFRNRRGVKETRVGYTGGQIEDPTYEKVCVGNTGHAEAVEVIYDPKEISYDELLEIFWNAHNPTQLNRQGPDVGEQYRSAIFYEGPEQEKAAKESKKNLEDSGKYKDHVVTEILPVSDFYPAEEYHQRYLEKNGRV